MFLAYLNIWNRIHTLSYVKHSVLPEVYGRCSINISYYYLLPGIENYKKNKVKKKELGCNIVKWKHKF